jgi:hypothetical protein
MTKRCWCSFSAAVTISRKHRGPVVAAPADQPHALLIEDDHHAVAVMLDLVQPVGTPGHLTGFGGERKRVQHRGSHVSLMPISTTTTPLQEEAMQIHRLSESRQLYIFQSGFHIEHGSESIEIIDVADDALPLLLQRFADHEIIDLRSPMCAYA